MVPPPQVTEDGLTAETILKIKILLGTSFTLYPIMMNFHYIDKNKIIFNFKLFTLVIFLIKLEIT